MSASPAVPRSSLMRVARDAPFARAIVVLAVVALGAVALAGAAAPATARTVTVSVDARDFAFSLSRRTVPAGSTVRFVVRNRGNTAHDFVVAKKRTRILRPGQRQTITASFPRKGVFRFLCSVSGHARLGMKGAFGVSIKPPAPPPAPPPVDTSDVASLTRIGSFEQPVLVTAPPGDTSRVFVVEQGGTVRIVRDGTLVPSPFLDIREQVTARGESGLLSIAFAPDYASTGLVYAFYNAREGPYGDIRIAEFRVDASDPDRVDPSSERAVLSIPKPYENHNGGMLQFGADGYLYASVGDGDPGVLNRAGAFAQRLDVLLGNIIRIDPRRGDPYAVPIGQSVPRGARRPTRGLGVRASEPLALLDRLGDRPPVRARRREHVARGDQRRDSVGTRGELRVAVLRGHGRLRRDGFVRRGSVSATRIPTGRRSLCGRRRCGRPRCAPSDPLGSLPVRRLLHRCDHVDRRSRGPRHRLREPRPRRTRAGELRRRWHSGVSTSCPSAATSTGSIRGPRLELGHPGRAAEPEPDRREQDVEDEVAEEHEEPPQGKPAKRDPSLLPDVALPARRRPERVAQRRLARCAVRARGRALLGHVVATARRRRSTSRMMRIAVSSTESSDTSMTGHRRRLWSFEASSSSAYTASSSA